MCLINFYKNINIKIFKNTFSLLLGKALYHIKLVAIWSILRVHERTLSQILGIPICFIVA